MKFIKDLFITFSTQITVVVLGLGTSIVVARVLGPAGQGAYALVILIPTLLAMVGNLGIGIANAYFGGKKKYSLADIATNSLIVAFILGIILSAIFLIYFLLFQPSFLSDVEPIAVVITALALPFSLLLTYFGFILLGKARIKEFNLLSLTQGAALLVLALLLLLGVRRDVLSPAIAWVGAFILASILSVWLVHRITGLSHRFNYLLLKESVKFGGQGYLGNVIQFLNYRLDMLLVAIFMNLTYVGYYSIAVPLAEALWYFPSAVGTVIFARTIGMSSEEANKSITRICRNTLFLTVLAAIALLVVGKYIILLLFGYDFLPALLPLQILIPGVVALSICKVLGNAITAQGKPIINTSIAGISLAVNIPLNVILIPKIGIAGAALASTISYTASAIFAIIFFVRTTRTKWTELLFIKSDDLKFYRQLISGVYNLSFDKDRRRVALQQILLELSPKSWAINPDANEDYESDSAEHKKL